MPTTPAYAGFVREQYEAMTAAKLIAPTTPLIVFAGGSHVYGDGVAHAETFPAQTIALLAPTLCDAINVAANGLTVSVLNRNAPITIDLLYAAGRSKNIVVLYVGGEDLGRGGIGVEEFFAGIVTFGQERRSIGFKVVICTLLPQPDEQFEMERQVFNARARTELTRFADALADVGADPTIGAPGAHANREYYQSDGTHPTGKGHGIIATIVKAAILTL
jgi:lysophospholipase L1-like esterase